MKNNKMLNMVLIVSSYLISTTLNIAFLYGLLFYNRIQTSSDPASWAILFSSFYFPGAVINIVAGTISDTYSKKKIMFYSEILAGLMTIIFMFSFIKGFNTTPYLAIYLSILSIFYAFFQVPLDASLINICDKKLAEKLISILWISRAIANTAGPIMGYYMSFSYSMIKMLFIINALSYLISAILQCGISFNEAKIYVENVGIYRNIKSKMGSLYLYIKGNRIIEFLFALNLVIALFYSPIFGAIVPAMSHSLNLENSSLSYIEGAKWIGIIISAIVVATFKSGSFYLKNLFNFITIQGLLFLLWLLPIFIPIDKSNVSYMFISLAIFDGILLTFENLGALTFFQVKIPEDVRGSLLGTMRTVMKVSGPIGIATYGLLLRYFSWSFMLLLTTFVILYSGIFLRRSKIYNDFINTI